MRYHPGTIVKSLGISDFRIDGVPTNEEEFLSMFHKKMPDGTYSNNPFTFGVTWDQVKTKLDELKILLRVYLQISDIMLKMFAICKLYL